MPSLKIKIGKIYIILLISLFLLIGSLAKLYDRFRNISPPPCMVLTTEGRHHEFKPNCQGSFIGRKGNIIEYKINEMGMRERSAWNWKKDRIVLLGDSHVEGWGLPFPQILSQKLERDDPSHSYLNMGIRSSGPLWQSLWYQTYGPYSIKAKKIIWILNENDAEDDHLSWALSEQYPTTNLYPSLKFSTEDFSSLSWHLPFLKLLPGEQSVWESMIKFPLYLRRVEKIKSRLQADQIEWCAPIDSMRLKFPETKLRFVLLSLGPYNSARKNNSMLDNILNCIKDQPTLDLRDELKNRYDLYQENDVHLNDAGNEYVADRLRSFLQ